MDKNKLFEEDIWIEGSMGYPSGDVELTFASMGVALSRTCMSSVLDIMKAWVCMRSPRENDCRENAKERGVLA